MSKTQKVELVFQKNGIEYATSDDIVRHILDLPLPDSGFDNGVKLIGAKVMDSIHTENGKEGGSQLTGWITMVTEIITEKDISKIVGSVLTIIDATITDQDQRKAFKSLIKQAIYNRYNTVIQRSHDIVHEQSYRVDTEPGEYLN